MKKVIVCISPALLAVIVLMLVVGGLTGCIDGRTPEIQRGEFPFRLEYEVGGEISVVEDALIIEFAGNSWNTGWGIHPTWTASLLSGRESIILFADDEVEIFYQPYMLSTTLSAFMGIAIGSGIGSETISPNPTIFRAKGDDTRAVSPVGLYYTYNFRIISWEIAPPIENTF